jgi:spermidine synthase
MSSTALGNHILVEFMNCDPHVMNDVAAIEQIGRAHV